MSIITVISFLIAIAIPGISLYIIFSRDFFSTGSNRFIGWSFFWGTAAFGLAYLTNSYLLNTAGIDWSTVVRFIAPVEEEIYKGLILIFLVRRKQFTYFVDGAIYGFAIGIGFAIVENLEYLLSTDQSVQLMVAVVRVISTNLMHATGSSIIGIAFGLSRSRRRTGQILYPLIGLILSGILHVIFNVISNSAFNSTIVLIITITIIGMVGFGMIIFAIRRGLKESRANIEEKLGMKDRVTAGETRAVLSLKAIDDILEPLAEMFGAEKAIHIEKLLKLQARMGILRKNLEDIQDENLLESTREDMEETRAQMEQERQAIGSYAMVYLRGVFPEDDSPLWGNLESMIAESTAPQAGGLWDQLGSQVKPKPEETNTEI
ncbi:MAG: PrsW family glutamic-type intramembrane protease [Chloroflexota bacterium]